jgi:hypothetical protein
VRGCGLPPRRACCSILRRGDLLRFYFFLLFLAGADFDFLAGDCEDDFTDFLVALFIRFSPLNISSDHDDRRLIVIYSRAQTQQIWAERAERGERTTRRAMVNEASRSQRRACSSRPGRAASGVV